MRSEMKVNDILEEARTAIRNGKAIMLALPIDTDVKCESCGAITDAIDCLETLPLSGKMQARLSCPSCKSIWGMIT